MQNCFVVPLRGWVLCAMLDVRMEGTLLVCALIR